MKQFIFTLSILFFISCKAQMKNVQLSDNNQKEVLVEFLNQEFSFRDSLYVKNRINIEDFSADFEYAYHRILNRLKKSDSLCKNAVDSLIRKEKCKESFNLNKFKNLFSKDDFVYLVNSYQGRLKDELFFDLKNDYLIPKIKNHSNKYYQSKELNFDEVPSLKIKGIYFTEKRNIALIAYSLTPYSLRYNAKYAILKKEDNLWWRYIGSIRL